MIENKVKVYFPGLNALRFFAAFLVFASHVELLKSRNEYNNYYYTPTFMELGGTAVTFFFVLSGFLITYLLFIEKDLTGKISLSQFYLRRILRIWPLYYTVVLAGFFILPNIPYLQNSLSGDLYMNFYPKLLLFMLLLPNVSYILFPHTPYISPAWSIGVEEQFYLTWPLLLSRTKKPLRLFIILISGIFILKTSLTLFQKISDNKSHEVIKKILDILYFSRFECMIIGSICAYILHQKKEQILKILFNKYLQIFCYVTIVIFLATGFKIPAFNHIIYSSLFGIIILNVAVNPHSLFKMENPVLNYLGQISFGLYMYHELAIGITIRFLKDLSFNFNNNGPNIFLYVLALLLTIAVASLSYYFLEKPFLKLKTRFSKISTT
ncbi:acyltransferase family protein [Daejeonella sp.]|uniref:acyltransferase family protein n=1 Tax=Daejeonella sp. TaxID=2805397 RepID=UPI003983761E